MVSVKLGSMDPDVSHYMQILNRYKGLSDGKCQDQGYSTDLLDPTQVESKNTIVKSNGLSRVLMLNLWIFSLEKNKSENSCLNI